MPTQSQVQHAAATIDELRAAWDRPTNFLLTDQCIPFDYEPPSISDLVDRVRKDEEARIRHADQPVDDAAFSVEFREMPIEKALEMPFSLAHFNLTRFTSRGDLLAGLWDGVVKPWERFLASAGFTWFRCYPIIFCSGRGVSGNYHADASDVVAWQWYGTKVFNGWHDPYPHLPLPEGAEPSVRKAVTKPEQIKQDELLSFRMTSGSVLWNQILTPHWVDAGDDEVALSCNISHGGLRLDGKLSQHGQMLEQYYLKHPTSRF